MTNDVRLAGEVTIPSMTLPMSDGLSPEARQFYTTFLQTLPGSMFAEADEPWEVARARWQPVWTMLVQQARTIYGVDVARETRGSVEVDVITPSVGVSAGNTRKVVVFAHPGGFCNGKGAISEAIGLSAVSGLTVVSVDYALAPESKFPAQVEQVIEVYRALLADRQPEQIAFVGTSAGAQILQMSVARLIIDGLPRPSSLTLFRAGLSPWLAANGGRGDTGHYGAALEGYIFHGGSAPRAGSGNADVVFDGVAPADRLRPDIAPLFSPDILRQFPPTLLMSGARDEALSGVLVSHRALIAVGVPTELHVWEGLCHGFWLVAGLPETTDAYRTAARFMATCFDRR